MEERKNFKDYAQAATNWSGICLIAVLLVMGVIGTDLFLLFWQKVQIPLMWQVAFICIAILGCRLIRYSWVTYKQAEENAKEALFKPRNRKS